MFAPVTPMLSFAPTQIGVNCLVFSHVFSIFSLVFCFAKADWLFEHLKKLIVPGTLVCFAPAFMMAFLDGANIVAVSKPVLYSAWAIFGLGELFLSLAWITLFSLMSARWVALSIAVGGVLSPPLVLLMLNVGNPTLGLAGIVFIIVIGCVIALYLFTRTEPEQFEMMKTYQHKYPVRKRASVSSAFYRLAYGFVVVMLCSMGLSDVLFAIAIAVFGSLVSVLWAIRRTKPKWNFSTVQRMTIPLVVAILLLIPFFDDLGRSICGGIAVATFAYTKLMEMTELVVMSAEFQIFPVRRLATGQLSTAIGFIVGALIALFAFIIEPLPLEPLLLLCCLIVIAVVTAYALFAGEKEEGVDDEYAIVSVSAAEDSDTTSLRNSAPFRERCDALAERYGLTNREAEIFNCLAKGRNAEHIQQTLFISSNTTRTHIRHIYRKMNISSQQQLIDLVDRQKSAHL
ncbi:MAG: helix-turn-helix transcriptional regulator [Coriobacteriales bacterium]|nr:helix-turn-helix transcriptional regulator [Coriobacteriales bacterium]